MKEILLLVIKNISRRKTRTILTTLGIIIGVAAVVGLVGSSNGIAVGINKELEKFESNKIFVLPGQLKRGFSLNPSAFHAKLSEKDVKIISQIDGVKIVSGEVQKSALVEYKKEKLILTVYGVEPKDFEKMDTLGLHAGRYLSNNDKYSVVIGYSVAHDLFDNNVTLRKKIIINGKEFRVVGIRKKQGGMLSTMEDTAVFIPKDVMRELFNINKNHVSIIVVETKKGYNTNDVGDEISKALCRAHKTCDNKDFTIITPKFVEETVDRIMSMISFMLVGIAFISLLVGAIGIANTMYTSVLERTREIGILKAVGASEKTIMMMFLLESGIIGLIGGIIGIIFGVGIGEGFLFFRHVMFAKTGIEGINTHVMIDAKFVLEMILFSFAIGVVSGFLPARKAAKLEAVEALRYE